MGAPRTFRSWGRPSVRRAPARVPPRAPNPPGAATATAKATSLSPAASTVSSRRVVRAEAKARSSPTLVRPAAAQGASKRHRQWSVSFQRVPTIEFCVCVCVSDSDGFRR